MSIPPIQGQPKPPGQRILQVYSLLMLRSILSGALGASRSKRSRRVRPFDSILLRRIPLRVRKVSSLFVIPQISIDFLAEIYGI